MLNAQETITIGSGNTTDAYLPTSTYYNYSMTQQIYTADEINSGAGFITHIAIRPATSNMSRNIIIYMENIDETAIPTTSGSMTYIVNDKPLYQGFTNFGNSGEWKTIELTTPFEYDGRNILLCISDITGSYYNGYQYFHTDETSVYSSVIKYRDGAKYDPTTEQYTTVETSYYGGTTYYAKKKRNQIQFTITPASANVEVSAESIALGDVRLGNYWTEKNASANVEIKATATTITSISCNNNFFTLNYDLNQNPVALNVSYNKEANVSGAQSGNITITSADCEPVVIPVTATAYTPANGDVYENPITVNFDANNSFTAQATGMYDDYILPGEAEDGNLNDAVYKFTLANDGVVTANVNGTNAIAAIYKAEDLQGNGPSSDNNYNGIVSGPTGPTTFGPYTFDDGDLSDFTLLDADGDGRNWAIESNKIDKNSICSYSYIQSQSITPNNYFYTNDSYAITANSKLTYKVLSTWSEYYAIVIFENGVETTVQEGIIRTSGTETKEVDLSAYAGKSVQIGFRHFNCTGEYYMAIDDLALTDGSAKSRAGENQIDGVQYPAGTYYLVAAAEGDFTLNLSTASLPAPESFAYTAPENNTIVEETNPELSWESAKYATSYDVYFGTTKVAEDITATSFQTTALSNNTKYNWQVVAKNSIGETKGEVYSFITPLDIPQNVTASSNEIYPDNNNVTIEWDAITGVKGYNVYVKAHGEDNATKRNDELVDTESYKLSNMDYSLNGHVVYVTAVYEIEGETYESNSSAAQTIKVTGYGEIYGTITDAANNKGIDDVTVTVTGTDEFGKAAEYTATTNGNGEYSFENVLFGTYSLTASKLDYQAITNPGVVVETNGGIEISFSLESNPSASFAVNAEEGRASWDAEYASYNVYRRDSEGVVKSLATEVKAEEYQDAEWETLADGEYEYGVSAMMELNAGFEEGFENGTLATGWSTINTNSYYNQYDWTVLDKYNSCNPYSGNYAIISKTNGSYYSGTSDLHYLITPEIDLSAVSSPKLEFYYFNKPGTQYGTQFTNTLEIKVKLSSEDDNSWKTIKTYSHCNNWTKATITTELEAYKGKSIKLAFVTNRYCCEFIALDDIVLTANTVLESRINWSAPVEKGGITFTGEGNWNTAANWNTVPESTDKVTINGKATITENVTVGSIRIASGATLTVKSGVVLNVTNGISNTNAAALVMEDGAQIIQTNSNVAATFNMNIVNPQKGWSEEQKDGWQFIASPLLNAKTSAFETSGENNDFDLYKYDGTKEGAEWVNYESHKRVGDTFEHNFNDGLLNGWTNLDATYQWNIATGGINSTYCLTSANSGTSYIMSPKVLVEEGSKFYFTAKVAGYYDQNLTVAVSETGNIDDMVTKLNNISIGTSNWQYQAERYITLDEYAGKEVYIIISHTSTYGYQIAIDNLRLTNAGGASDGTFETEFVNGRAYLASYQAETTATFTGVLNNATSFDYEVAYDAEKELANFHLLGNPFSFDMDWSGIAAEGLVDGYAVVNNQGGYDYLTSGNIKVGDGFFVKATGANASLSYNHKDVVPATRGSEKANSINVIATSKAGKDNVVVNFAGQAEGFNKLQNFNDAIATVYVSENGKNYGIANVDENTKEVALNFDAKEMGSYTISLDVNGEFETVTLVDRFTGVETNMLVEDEYSFIASNDDNVNRFVIRLAQGSQLEAQSQLVYQSGEELILSIEGSVQIVDMLGRVVYSNEHASGNNRIYVGEFNDASYVVRVINEEGVKVQKVVIY